MTQSLGLILILIANICLLHQPVNGDESLIKTVCEWTQWPDVCQECLSSTAGQYPDESDLAGESINCASTLSVTVIDDFAGMGNSTGDGAVKALCAGCQGMIGDAASSLEEASTDWSDGRYTDAGDSVEMAEERFYDFVHLCTMQLPNRWVASYESL